MTYVYRSIRLVTLLALIAPPLVAQTVADSGTFVVRHRGHGRYRDLLPRGDVHPRHPRPSTTSSTPSTATPPSWPGRVRAHDRHHGARGRGRGRIKARLLQRARIIFREDSAAACGHRAGDLDPGPGHPAGRFLPQHVVRPAGTGGAPLRAGGGKQVPFFNLAGGQTVSGTLTPVGKDSLALAIGDVEFRPKADPRRSRVGRRDTEAGRAGGPH